MRGTTPAPPDLGRPDPPVVTGTYRGIGEGDACHATNGCQQAPIAGSCNDDDACTVSDNCVGANCQNAPYPCNEPGCLVQTCVDFIGLRLCLCL